MGLRLTRAPIVEAVVDIDCDMPPGQEIGELLSRASEAFRDHYPKPQTQFLQELHIAQESGGKPQLSTREPGIQALQFLQEDEKQLVQIRAQGFSFNRLAPYTSLDDYLPEIERTWRLFVELASPALIRRVRLRYINRIPLPLTADGVDLDEYVQIGPRLPDDETLTLVGFLNQQRLVEEPTGNQASITLTTQPGVQDVFPLILDIAALREESAKPENWAWVLVQIQSLRMLKNRVFKNSLTKRCLELFR